MATAQQRSSAALGVRSLRLAGTLALVALVTAVNWRILGVNSATAAFSYLLVILALATRAGREESVLASIVSMFCYNYFFLPPVGTLTIADPQNWVALGVFLITALTASHLSTSARRRAEEASARRQEIEKIYEFSRALMIGDQEERVANQITQHIAKVFGASGVAFFEQSTDVTVRVGNPAGLTDERLRTVTRTGERWEAGDGEAIVPVALGGRSIGSLGVAGFRQSPGALPAVAQLAAIALERARAQSVASRAEAMRQNEMLKSTLLDALAHEFKTPLTSIKAAIGTLLTTGAHDAVEQELLTVVDEESDRLNNLVTESIDMARIAAGQVRLRPEPCLVRDLCEATIARLQTVADGRPVTLDLPNDLTPVLADGQLIGLVLRQLVGNALKYAPPGLPVQISAQQSAKTVTIQVTHGGPGIPASEQSAIFEKFYRGQQWRERIPGTGLGLTIARDIVQAHGGSIWVNSEPGQGVQFSFSLPVAYTANTDGLPTESESIAR